MENAEETYIEEWKIGKISKKDKLKSERYEKYGRKVCWIMKTYGKYRRKVSWIVKRYVKYERKASRLVKRYWKYWRK